MTGSAPFILNKSAYCVAHNANTPTTDADGEGEGWSFSDGDVMKLLDPAYAPDDPAERAAVRYARAATEDHTDAPRGLLDELARRMTPPEIVELACVVGLWSSAYGRCTTRSARRRASPSRSGCRAGRRSSTREPSTRERKCGREERP